MCPAFDDARVSTAIRLTKNFDYEYHGSWFQNLHQFENILDFWQYEHLICKNERGNI